MGYDIPVIGFIYLITKTSSDNLQHSMEINQECIYMRDKTLNTKINNILSLYLIGPFSAGPFLTPSPLTPALIVPVLKMRPTPIRAGVKRATSFSKSGVIRAAFFGKPM